MEHHTLNNETIGVLLTNLGTPDAATPSAVRRYLADFLWDPRVVEIPRPLWWLILNAFVLRTRPAQSAKAYQKIWTDEGSPLLITTLEQSEKLDVILNERFPNKIRIIPAMRYGKPAIADALEQFRKENIRRILIFPLYPQYSATTTASTFDAVNKVLKHWRWIPEIRTINQYADSEAYIEALADSVQQHYQEYGKPDKLLFSFHGLPKRFHLAGDPYYHYCHTTAQLLTDKLEFMPEEWLLTFQSRFGRAEWLQPYTDMTLKKLPSQNIKRIAVICPGFSSDCLETLEEINMQNREVFMNAGGEVFHYIPALNSRDKHIEMLAKIVISNVQGWVSSI